jgi:hypothetical protein
LDDISSDQNERGYEGEGTASTETIRRTLLAGTVPNWPNMRSMLLALIELRGDDPMKPQGCGIHISGPVTPLTNGSRKIPNRPRTRSISYD